MESRLRVLLLIRTLALSAGLTLSLSACGLFGGEKAPPPLGAETEQTAEPEAIDQEVINPNVTRRRVKVPGIDNENFEIGAIVGILSIEDFGSSGVYGARLAYHISEDFFLEASYGLAKGGLTSSESVFNTRLIPDEDRKYNYYALNIGWNALPGEIFLGENRAYNSAFYLTAGLGGTDFAGDNRFTVNGGVGYRVLITDWVAVHFDFRDYLFDIDILGEKKVAHNLEGSLGITVFF
ncbi:MAG: outer membrane beta-barrel domain-containing protein [Candidatus Obscuribacterales bacterium]|nr:outer membrane beta-barrel domain-containing protein [Steroidobacteraceae bacterium]